MYRIVCDVLHRKVLMNCKKKKKLKNNNDLWIKQKDCFLNQM